MQINVIARMSNLCVPVRLEMERQGLSHLAVLNACNSYLGRLKGEQSKLSEDKRGDGKYNVKKDTFKMSIKPATVLFKGTQETEGNAMVGLFIAWHDAVSKAHNIAPMEYAHIPTVFTGWLEFAKQKTEQTPAEQSK